MSAEKIPRYIYAENRDEAQRLLDESYLQKYRAVPVRWWRPHPNHTPKSLGFARYCYALGLLTGWFAYWIVATYA